MAEHEEVDTAFLCDCGAVLARWRELRALIAPSSASVVPQTEETE